MSRENIELVRRLYEAAAARDTPAVYEIYDPAVVLDNSNLVGIGGGIYRGHDGLREFFRTWHEVWDRIEYSYDELIDAGAEAVIALVTRHATGRASGAAVERPAALLFNIRDNSIVRVVWFDTREEALAAAAASRWG